MKKEEEFQGLVLLGVVFIMFLNLLSFGLIFISLAINNFMFYSIMGIIYLVIGIIVRFKFDELDKILKNAKNKKNR